MAADKRINKEDDYELESCMDSELRVFCSSLGMLHYHVPDSRYCEPGYPDWTIVMGEAVIFAEFKRNVRERATWEQLAWLNAIIGLNGDMLALLVKGRYQYGLLEEILKTGSISSPVTKSLYQLSMRQITEDYDYWLNKRGVYDV